MRDAVTAVQQTLLQTRDGGHVGQDQGNAHNDSQKKCRHLRDLLPLVLIRLELHFHLVSDGRWSERFVVMSVRYRLLRRSAENALNAEVKLHENVQIRCADRDPWVHRGGVPERPRGAAAPRVPRSIERRNQSSSRTVPRAPRRAG